MECEAVGWLQELNFRSQAAPRQLARSNRQLLILNVITAEFNVRMCF
jgi:hypothetical protein